MAMNGPLVHLATRDSTRELQILDGELPLRADLRDVDHDGMIVVSCLGDSNTDPSWWPGPAWVEQLDRILLRPEVVFVNKGLGGGTAVDVPDWPYDAFGQLTDTLANDRPDAVIMSFGTNDLRLDYTVEDTVDAYLELKALAEENGALVLVALTPSIASSFPDAAVLNPLYEELNARLAATFPADVLIDFAEPVTPDDYRPDGIHLGVAGHAKRALAAYERLLF